MTRIMGSPIFVSDRPHPRGNVALRAISPALETFGYVALMLGLFMLALTLLIAWIRTPEAYFVSTDPRLPHVVRGGESLRSLLPWLKSELLTSGSMIVAGLAAVRALHRPSIR